MGKALVIKGASFEANSLDQVTFEADRPCTALTLSANTATFEYFGDTVTITATPTPANTTDLVTWSSSNDSIASVNSGVITLNGLGNATITATCGSITATVSISQSSAKVKNIFKHLNMAASRRSEESPNVVIYGNNQTFDSIAQDYDADDTLLHPEGGYERGLQMILVPYGATVVSLTGTGSSSLVFRHTSADIVNRTTHNEVSYPTWLSLSSTYLAEQTVTAGQAITIALSHSGALYDYVDGVVFSVS